jgi:competence protein ComEC
LESIGGLGTLVELRAAECDTWTGQDLGVASIPDEIGSSGATFAADGWLTPLRADRFDTARARAGAQASLAVRELEVTGDPTGPRGLAARVRGGLEQAVAGLDRRVGGLLKGLSIGDTSDLDEQTLELFRNAGLSHILAVSGSNVAIVLASVMIALRTAGHAVRIFSGYLGLALFLLVVGPDASVLRAIAMGAITLACLMNGRKAEPLAALGVAVIAVLALRPGMLFSVGLQLSVGATAGIVLFSEPIARRMLFLPAWLRTLMSATLAAQFAVAPILVLVFGEISLVAPIANAFALPAVGPGTVVGLGAGVVAVLSPGVGALMATVVSPSSSWILFVADRLGGLSWSLIHLPPAAGWPLLVMVIGAGGLVLSRATDAR